MTKTLIYVHDPMCSWCWGFEPVRKQLFSSLPNDVAIKRLVGGLAPDSHVAMPQDMQKVLQSVWRKIEDTIPGTQFNFDFWTSCAPRRSTYPSNRAVIAARLQGEHFDEQMSLRIQQAYYSEAKNPSDDDLLIALAKDIGLDAERFALDLNSDAVNGIFEEELKESRQLGMNSFPSLAYQIDDNVYPLEIDYLNPDTTINKINFLNDSHQ